MIKPVEHTPRCRVFCKQTERPNLEFQWQSYSPRHLLNKCATFFSIKEKRITRMSGNPTDSFVPSRHRFQIKPIKGVVFVSNATFETFQAGGTENGAAISSPRATANNVGARAVVQVKLRVRGLGKEFREIALTQFLSFSPFCSRIPARRPSYTRNTAACVDACTHGEYTTTEDRRGSISRAGT